MYNDYLAHYGVKGMKWGVRRFQKKDDDIVIKKGDKVYHTTTNKKLALKKRPIFVGSTQRDLETYTGPYAANLLEKKVYGGSYEEDPYIYLNEYTTKRNLRIPGITNMKHRFDEIYDKNPRLVKQAMKVYYDQHFRNGNIKNNTSYNDFFEDKDRMFAVFADGPLNYYLQSESQKKKQYSSAPFMVLAKGYVDSFKKEKYSAILDMHDRDTFFSAEQPLVVLNGRRYLNTSKITNMSVDDIIDVTKLVRDAGYTSKQDFVKYSDI